MTSLVVVESPNKVPKISSILGNKFTVLASVGHIRDLPEKGDIGFTPPDFNPRYEESVKKKNVIAKLKQAAKNADAIYLATDPDREGEAIAYHIAQVIGLKINNATRVTFNAVTPDAVKAAFEQPRNLDMAMVRSQEARRVLDRAIGWEISRLLRKNIGSLTAGRVQTVAVRLIFDRENEIQNFQPINHFVVEAKFGKWKAVLDVKSIGCEQYLLDNEQAKQLKQAITYFTVSDYQEKPRLKAPPAPFTTSTLQAEAGRVLKFSTSKTMEVAQSLFAKGLITYHRTDAPHFAPEGIEEIKKYLRSQKIEIYPQTRSWKAKAGAQEGHEAIRPVHIETEQAGENSDERSLYSLIRKRAIATVLPDAVYATKSVKLETLVNGKTVVFKAQSSQLEKAGWLSFYNQSHDTDDKSDDDGENLPVLKIGEQLKPQSLDVVAKKTQPPSRFDEPRLVVELEKRGIGRPSTYASIITKILDYKYVIKNKQNQLIPTDSAATLCGALVGKFSFAEYDYTKNVEEELDEIAQEKNTYLDVVTNEWDVLSKEIQNFYTTTHKILNPCPNCGKPLIRRKNKNGNFFWGCSGYPDCKTILQDLNGKPTTERVDPTITKYTCKICGKPLKHLKGTSKKTGNPYDIFVCSGKPDCNQIYPAKSGKPVFPK